MCNLYSHTKGQQAIIEFTRAMKDRTGNLPPQPGIFPDYTAPIVRNSPDGRELVMARWGMPSSSKAIFDATSKGQGDRSQGQAGRFPGSAAERARQRHDQHQEHVVGALEALART